MSSIGTDGRTESKRETEKETVGFMIGLFCRKNHGTSKGHLCQQCQELKDYAFERTDSCPYMETKTFCSNCRTHCYRPEMRERIREVMRFSGPRMILHRPGMAVKHLRATRKERKRLESEENARP